MYLLWLYVCFILQELLQELFHSYLNLLVNSRSEVAFAHIFNTPDRGLTHQAFTHLRHQARRKKMSLYQVSQRSTSLCVSVKTCLLIQLIEIQH
jgi:hypothetical protein